MRLIKKSVLMVSVFMLMLAGDLQLSPTTLRIGMFPDAQAILGVWRRAARRTAVVVGGAELAAAATATTAAAAADAEAATAAAAATPPPVTAAPATPAQPATQAADAPADHVAKALPLGAVVETLPEGCKPFVKADIEYQHCGPNYYRAVFQANNLVYVTAQP